MPIAEIDSGILKRGQSSGYGEIHSMKNSESSSNPFADASVQSERTCLRTLKNPPESGLSPHFTTIIEHPHPSISVEHLIMKISDIAGPTTGEIAIGLSMVPGLHIPVAILNIVGGIGGVILGSSIDMKGYIKRYRGAKKFKKENPETSCSGCSKNIPQEIPLAPRKNCELAETASVSRNDSAPNEACSCKVKDHYVRKAIHNLRINLPRNLLDIHRTIASIVANIIAFLSFSSSIALNVASGFLGFVVGVGGFFLYIWQWLKLRTRLENVIGENKNLIQTNDAEEKYLFKTLDRLKIKHLKQQIRNSKVLAAIYGFVGVLGTWGLVSGALLIAGISISGAATAGVVPAIIFLVTLTIWGGRALFKTVKKHRDGKKLQAELQRDIQNFNQKQREKNKLREEIDSISSMPEKRENLSNIEKWSETEKVRLKELQDKWLKSHPQNAVEYLLGVLFEPDSNNVLQINQTVMKYLKSRSETKTDELFHSAFQLLKQQWSVVLEEERKAVLLPTDNDSETERKYRQKIVLQARQKAVQTACKMLKLES